MIHVVTPANMCDNTGSATQPVTSFTFSKSTALQFFAIFTGFTRVTRQQRKVKTRHSKTFLAGCLPLQLLFHNHSHDLTQSLVYSVTKLSEIQLCLEKRVCMMAFVLIVVVS